LGVLWPEPVDRPGVVRPEPRDFGRRADIDGEITGARR
jgi:hypothetical protein